MILDIRETRKVVYLQPEQAFWNSTTIRLHYSTQLHIVLNNSGPKVLIQPEPVNVTFTRNSVCRWNQVKIRPYWVGLGPKSDDWYPCTGMKREIWRYKRQSCDNRKRNRHHTATSPGMPSTVSSHQSSEGCEERDQPGVFKKVMALLINWFQTSRLVWPSPKSSKYFFSPKKWKFSFHLSLSGTFFEVLKNISNVKIKVNENFSRKLDFAM